MRGVIAAVAAATALSGTLVAVSGPAEAAHRPAWHVTLHAKRTAITLGQRVVFTGHVNKSAAGKLVRLQERHRAGATWNDQANALVHKDGDFKVSDRPTVNNRRSYRVVLSATKHHKKGVSNKVAVDVYKWTSLTTMTTVNQEYFEDVASVSFDAVTYPSSLEAHVPHWDGAPTTQSVEFNLDHRCTRFRGTFGLSDDSVSGSNATVTASADGTQWFSRTFEVGESSPSTITFPTAPLKVRFTSTSGIADADGSGAVGTPEVYCEQ
jgi:hypothetical protein